MGGQQEYCGGASSCMLLADCACGVLWRCIGQGRVAAGVGGVMLVRWDVFRYVGQHTPVGSLVVWLVVGCVACRWSGVKCSLSRPLVPQQLHLLCCCRLTAAAVALSACGEALLVLPSAVRPICLHADMPACAWAGSIVGHAAGVCMIVRGVKATTLFCCILHKLLAWTVGLGFLVVRHAACACAGLCASGPVLCCKPVRAVVLKTSSYIGDLT